MNPLALQDKMKAVGAERRKKIEARAAELRRAHHLTQSKVAGEFGRKK